jgi:hypothetical protein
MSKNAMAMIEDAPIHAVNQHNLNDIFFCFWRLLKNYMFHKLQEAMM